MSKFIVEKFNILSCWSYNLQFNTECSICRCDLNTNSIYNQEKGLDSKLLENVNCGHVFHKECIISWTLKNNRCPICSADWIGKMLSISKN